jgi:hypothetical protein
MLHKLNVVTEGDTGITCCMLLTNGVASDHEGQVGQARRHRERVADQEKHTFQLENSVMLNGKKIKILRE